MLNFANLLLHTDDVPEAARSVLASALRGPAEQRCENLVEAARILHREAGLPCADARELVGLHGCNCAPAAA